MSAITRLLKNKKVLLIGGAAVVVLGVSSLALLQNTPTDETNEPQMSAADKKFYEKNDKLKQEGLDATLQNIANSFAVGNKPLPPATSDGWQTVLDTVVINNKMFDPYLPEKLYSFTDKTPEYGEIQYGPGMTCDKDGSLMAGYGLSSLALRARFSDGIRCVNNFQGQAV